jgi:hypothetical protein
MQEPSVLPKEAHELAETSHAPQSVMDNIYMSRLAIDETYALIKKVDELLTSPIIGRAVKPLR